MAQIEIVSLPQLYGYQLCPPSACRWSFSGGASLGV